MESTAIKLKRTIKEGYASLRNFGWEVTLAKLRCIWEEESLRSVQKKNTAILAYLQREYATLLSKYATDMAEQRKEKEGASVAPIWVFWWQGGERMPDIIRMCQKSRENAAGKHPIILLTQDNVKEYVAFPAEIWEQFSAGKLRIQHLADMIRVQLIQKYGGLWMDASIYCHKDIPESIFDYPLFSLKGEELPQFVSKNRWTTFLIGGQAGNVLCSFLNEFFLTYCCSEKPFIDYYMFDCAIALAYENIPAVRREIDCLPVTEGDCYWLNRVLEMPAEKELIRQMGEEPSIFYKISWNRRWEQVKAGSLYHYLLERIWENKE